MNQQIKDEIKAAETMQDVFNVLAKYYDLPAVKMSMLSKNIMLNNMESIIKFMNVPLKQA